MVSRQVHEGDVQTSGYRQNDFFPEEAFAKTIRTLETAAERLCSIRCH
jgi:hypothetical protein